MAGKSLESIMGYVPLLGVVRTTVSGIPNPLPKEFMNVTQKCIGDSGVFTQITGERRLATTGQYGGPAKAQAQRSLARVPIKLIHSYESQPITPLTMQQLMSFNKYEQDKGAAVIGYQVREFAKRSQNLRIAATIMLLGTGVIYRDSSGNVLPTSSGSDANLTVSAQIAAAHQGQLLDTTFSGTALIDAKWSLPTTDIPQQIVALDERASQEHGYPLTHIYYGKNVAKYVMNNDFTQDYLVRNPPINTAYVKNSGIIPQGLFGKTWVPMWLSTFRSSDDATPYSLWDGDLVVFTPDPASGEELEDWWGWAEGSFLVPNTVDLVTTQQGLGAFEMKYGMGAYGQMSHNPPGLINYQFDTFLPYVRNPSVIYQADVVF